jgi:energy-coupling factor transporter ATP-binding protein EcfA2
MDVVIGERHGYGQRLPFGLSIADRRQHLYLIGKTGSGKSTLLRNLIVQDIEAGRGCMLLDPHGDLADELLDHIPPRRTEDLIYFHPADLSHPIGLNLLERVPADDRPLVASSVVSIFKHLWRDSWGPRLEYVLYNTIAALLDFPPRYGSVSLLAVPRMLADPAYRETIVHHIEDVRVRAFWQTEFPKSTQFAAEVVSPIQNKVGALLAAPAVRNVLGQAISTLRIGEAMDRRRIVIANLGKGFLGEDKANLMGSLLVTAVQLAAMRRASVPEGERVDFAVYLDEFHNFTTDAFAAILAEARKYRLALVIGHQYLDQVDPHVRAAVFGNVGTLISFGVGHSDADELTGEFHPYSAGALRDLGRGQVCVRMISEAQQQEPFLAETMPSTEAGYGNRNRVLDQSRRRYGRPREGVEEKLQRWMTH